MPRSCTIFLVFFAVLSAQPLWSAEDGNRSYLPIGSVDAQRIATAPPRPGSAEFEQQMSIVLWLQHTRTPEQVSFVSMSLEVDRFAFLVNEGLLEVDGIALKRTIDDAIDEVRAEYDLVKAQYDLPRPFQVNAAVIPVVSVRPVESYPSGHAIRAIVYARLLSEVFPEARDKLIEYAEQIGYGRVIAGVHYPMDVVAGQKLGHAYADVIIAQKSFAQALQQIRFPN